MAENMKKNEDVEQLTNEITDMGSKTKTLLIKKKENIDSVDKQRKDILAEASTVVGEAKQKLDTCHDQFKKQFSLVQKENSTKLVDTKERLENFQNFLSYCEKTLKTVTKYGSPKQTFVTLEKIKSRLDLQGKELEEFLKDDQDLSYKLVLDKRLTALDTSMGSIAEVRLQYTPRDIPVVLARMSQLLRQLKSADISKLKAVKLWEVNAGGCITGGLFLDDDNLMCVNRDKENMSVFDNKGQLLITYPLNFEPWSICQSSDGSVFVSENTYCFNNSRRIIVFTITNQSLKEVKQINIQHMFLAINIMEGKMLVQVDTNPQSIRSTTLDGNNDKNICLCSYGSGIAVSTSSGRSRFYYYEEKAVVCRSLDGREEFRHKLQLNNPRGIALDVADNIYVCNKESNNIL